MKSSYMTVEFLRRAQAIVRESVLYKRFIDGTPLENDIAVWMADFAGEVLHEAQPALAPVAASPQEKAHTPPAVHHLCGPNVIGVTGPPQASWCYHDKTWVDGAAQQDDYTCSACGTKICTNISEWAASLPSPAQEPKP